MELLKQLHTISLANPFPFVSPFNTPLALVTFILFVWSIGPTFHLKISTGLLYCLRLNWFVFLWMGLTGFLLSIQGYKVASATDIGGGVTRYGFRVDPVRDLEHMMYAAFCLISLYAIEVLLQGKVVEHKKGLRLLPAVTLFLYGAAYMVGRVAVFPGND